MDKQKKFKQPGLIICDAHVLEAAPQDDGRIELCVALAGEWKSRDMKVTDRELQQMADNFRLEGRDILFDYDHKCLGGFFDPGDSRAAGWGKSLELREGALFVQMEPTPRGREAIESGEFRYLSPVYEYQRADRVTGKTKKDWRLHSVALTNTPFLTELPAIKNTENVGGPNMEELLKALGANSEEEAIAKVQELTESLANTMEEVAALKAQVNEAEVNQAVTDKKLLPAQKDLATKLINSSRELYDEFVANSASTNKLTEEVRVEEGADDGLDPFKNVQSFGDLLKNDDLRKQMEQEQPERYNALYLAYMKGGK